jgi:hypothetical protein
MAKLERVIIPSAPKVGSGLHDWGLVASRKLLVAGWEVEQTIERLALEMIEQGRPEHIAWKDAKLETEGAKKWLDEHPGYTGKGRLGYSGSGVHPSIAREYYSSLPRSMRLYKKDTRPEYLPLDLEFQNKVLESYHYATLPSDVGDFDIGDLFANIDFLVCAAKSVVSSKLIKLSDLISKHRLDSFELTVASPFVDAVVRDNKGNKINPKRDCNVCKRMYQIVEFDKVESLQDQIRLMLWLNDKDFLDLAMIVYSGNKSLHGWFTCWNNDESEIRTFFQEATKIGADPRMRVPSQFCRMPDGYNQKYKRKQDVIYYRSDIVLAQADRVREVVL